MSSTTQQQKQHHSGDPRKQSRPASSTGSTPPPPPPRRPREDAVATTSSALPLGQRITVRLQPVSKTIVGVMRLVRLVVAFVLDYALAFAVATVIVPGIFSTVGGAVGLKEGDSIDLIIAGWIAPSLFLLLVLLVGTLWLMRGIWRVLGLPISRVKHAFGLKDQDNGR